MKTSDDLWRWIWEEDRVFDEDVLAELFDGLQPGPSPPPPATRSQDVWEWLSTDDPLLEPDPLGEIPPAEPRGAARPPDVPIIVPPPARVPPLPAPAPPLPAPAPPLPAPAPAPALPSPAMDAEPLIATEEPADAVPPLHAESPAPAGEGQMEAPAVEAGRRQRRWGRPVRYLGLVMVAAAAGSVAPQVVPAVLPSGETIGSKVAVVPEQTVLAWTVVDDDRGLAFVALMAAGARPPVVVAVPADVTINLPGQGLGTVREAAVSKNKGPLAVALENLVGVPVDASVTMTVQELAAAVDGIGTMEVADQAMNGGAVLAYLTAPEAAEVLDERFLRWQDVLEGIRDGVAANPAAVTGFPEPLRPVLAAGSPEPMALYGLPVVDLGAGLLRPDEEGLGTLVEDLFVPHAGAEVRIVVLNGVGRPGVGEQVARILVPEGFRLMSTGNANTFGVKTTKIIALSEDDLAAAHRAREHLGVGEVLLAEPTGLADIQIVVGQDFVDAILGGA
jgi:LytR cell envelope-related transcriptional attenuator